MSIKVAKLTTNLFNLGLAENKPYLFQNGEFLGEINAHIYSYSTDCSMTFDHKN